MKEGRSWVWLLMFETYFLNLIWIWKDNYINIRQIQNNDTKEEDDSTTFNRSTTPELEVIITK